MAKIRRDQVVNAALELLDEVGLDTLSTRLLAKKLGVESATLYWHFRNKSVLLAEMAAAVVTRNHVLGVPANTAQWPEWFADNARSFRHALLAHRDGARLHAGTTPDRDTLPFVALKVAYLVRVGFSEQEAQMALLTASQFTVGCVLEEQARHQGEVNLRESHLSGEAKLSLSPENNLELIPFDPEVAFEFGLGLIVDGLRVRTRLIY